MKAQGNSQLMQVLQRLERLPDLEKGRRHRDGFGLEGIHSLLATMGNPHENLDFIHLAGSKGKGTTLLFLTALLHNAGYRTGSFMSPHLHSLSERFLINGVPVAEDKLAATLEMTAAAADQVPGCTLFDIFTASAITLFKEADCTAVLMECGLGGRLDSTNAITPRTTIITTVEREHEDILGRGIGRVAIEKAGIIKPQTPLVTGCRGEALRVIRRRAAALAAPCTVLQSDFGVANIEIGTAGYTVKMIPGGERIETGIRARAQLESLSLATTAFTKFTGRQPTATEVATVSQLPLPGRFEFLPGKPSMLLDVAHTPRSLVGLAREIRTWFPDHHLTLLFGIARDKRWRRPLSLLSTLAGTTWLVKLPDHRGVSPEELATVAKGETQLVFSIEKAISAFHQNLGKGDLVLITGSHQLVGPARLAQKGQTGLSK